MQKRFRLITVLIVAIALVLCALLLINRLNGDIDALKKNVKTEELNLRLVQQEDGEISTEITNMNKESYIIAQARKLGYLMPGEIRFVVVNPEVLEDSPENAIVEELKEE